MLLTRNNIEPRLHLRSRNLKSALKHKPNPSETSPATQTLFNDIQIAHSHQINDLDTNQFQFNIFPPTSSNTQVQTITKKLIPPQWILNSHISSIYMNPDTDTTSENPQTPQNHKESSQDYQDYSSLKGKKTDSQNTNELIGANKSQIQRILQMTVSDDKERQMNETNSKSEVKAIEDLELNSAVFYRFHNEDLEQINQTTYDMRNHHKNESSIKHKAKSAIIRPAQNLERYYKDEMEMFSEYGLKPYEENRLKKIQQLEKLQLLKEQSENLDANEPNHFQQCQQYFNRSKYSKTGNPMSKVRKGSQVVQKCFKESNSKQQSRKSLSKSKQSLSKGKKLMNPKLTQKKV